MGHVGNETKLRLLASFKGEEQNKKSVESDLAKLTSSQLEMICSNRVLLLSTDRTYFCFRESVISILFYDLFPFVSLFDLSETPHRRVVSSSSFLDIREVVNLMTFSSKSIPIGLCIWCPAIPEKRTTESDCLHSTHSSLTRPAFLLHINIQVLLSVANIVSMHLKRCVLRDSWI